MSNLVVSGSFDSFASPDVRLSNDAFNYLLNFFRPEELVLVERVCSSWKQFIKTTGQWKKQCQYQLNIPAHIDPKGFLPAEWNYKKGALLAFAKVFDRRMYQYYLEADVGPVPPIPEEISLARADEPDPCDPTSTIGLNYTWFYCPKDFTFENPPFDLDKPDDPNDEEAPKLIQKEAGKPEKKRILTAPTTLNNIGEIFKHPKNGNPSGYYYIEGIWEAFVSQHSNKRVSAEWVCMRDEPIGKNQPYLKQQETAKKAGVAVSSLLHRVQFNFLKHMDSGAFPDSRDTWTYVHTSTFIHDANGYTQALGCGLGDHSGLIVNPLELIFCSPLAAVVLPIKV